jgi:hypothetical protein
MHFYLLIFGFTLEMTVAMVIKFFPSAIIIMDSFIEITFI